MSTCEKVWLPSSAPASSHMLSSDGRASGSRLLQILPSLTKPTTGTDRAVNVASNFAVLALSAERSQVSPAGTDTAGRSSNVMAIFRAVVGRVTSAPKASPAMASERPAQRAIENFIILTGFECEVLMNHRRRARQGLRLAAIPLMLDGLADNRVQRSGGGPTSQAADMADARN